VVSKNSKSIAATSTRRLMFHSSRFKCVQGQQKHAAVHPEFSSFERRATSNSGSNLRNGGYKGSATLDEATDPDTLGNMLDFIYADMYVDRSEEKQNWLGDKHFIGQGTAFSDVRQSLRTGRLPEHREPETICSVHI
jgi:hypothetical protein